MLLGTLVNAAYFGFGYSKTFGGNILKNFFKALVINVLGLSLFVVSMMIVGTLVVLVVLLIKKVMA